ncbi:MAG: acyl carrier protein [Burkholderiales bacterium]
MYAQLAKRVDDALPKRAPDEAAIQRWLVTKVAALVGQGESDIDITQPFSSYALDSVGTVGLTGELQEWLGIKLPPTLLWDYPSIELLARHLAARGGP